jgi:hypothetical protein
MDSTGKYRKMAKEGTILQRHFFTFDCVLFLSHSETMATANMATMVTVNMETTDTANTETMDTGTPTAAAAAICGYY